MRERLWASPSDDSYSNVAECARYFIEMKFVGSLIERMRLGVSEVRGKTLELTSLTYQFHLQIVFFRKWNNFFNSYMMRQGWWRYKVPSDRIMRFVDSFWSYDKSLIWLAFSYQLTEQHLRNNKIVDLRLYNFIPSWLLRQRMKQVKQQIGRRQHFELRGYCNWSDSRIQKKI